MTCWATSLHEIVQTGRKAAVIEDGCNITSVADDRVKLGIAEAPLRITLHDGATPPIDTHGEQGVRAPMSAHANDHVQVSIVTANEHQRKALVNEESSTRPLRDGSNDIN